MYGTHGRKAHEERLDALSIQLSNTSTLVEHGPVTATPHALFEGAHFHDPHTTWTRKEESRVMMKTDMRLIGWLCIMYFGFQLDSFNLANALADNFLKDLGFTMAEYSNGVMIYRICYLLGRLPGQLLAMRYGYRYIFTGLMTAYGLVAWTQAWMQGETGFYIARALIGLCEGSFPPLAVMCLSGFYTNTELGFRVAILTCGVNIARALSSLLAAGLLNMRGMAGRPGWFYLFLINGLVIFVIGLMSMLYLPGGPKKTKGVIWRKSWYSEGELVIMINRLLRDDPSKGRTSSKAHASLHDIWHTLKDPSLIGLFVAGAITYIPKSPVSMYLVLNLRQLGFSRFESNVLTIPSDLLRVVTVLALTWSSGHFEQKAIHCIIPLLIEIPLFMALLLLPPHGYPWVRFAIITLVIGSPSSHPIVLSWISRNSSDPRKRGIAVALFSTFHELGSIAAAHIYREEDKPYYYTGNKVLISISAVAILIFLAHREVLRRLNHKKQKAWKSLSEPEQREYVREQDHRLGNKSLIFTFSY